MAVVVVVVILGGGQTYTAGRGAALHNRGRGGARTSDTLDSCRWYPPHCILARAIVCLCDFPSTGSAAPNRYGHEHLGLPLSASAVQWRGIVKVRASYMWLILNPASRKFVARSGYRTGNGENDCV